MNLTTLFNEPEMQVRRFPKNHFNLSYTSHNHITIIHINIKGKSKAFKAFKGIFTLSFKIETLSWSSILLIHLPTGRGLFYPRLVEQNISFLIPIHPFSAGV